MCYSFPAGSTHTLFMNYLSGSEVIVGANLLVLFVYLRSTTIAPHHFCFCVGTGSDVRASFTHEKVVFVIHFTLSG